MWQPKRTCRSCRTKKEKHKLLRIACTKDGKISLGAGDGRGVYVCSNEACIQTLQEKHLLGRAFHREIDPQIFVTLKEMAKES